MSSNTAIKSKLHKLSKFFRLEKQKGKVAVVYFTENSAGERIIDYPPNVADNILMIPYPCHSIEAWEKEAMVWSTQRTTLND